MTCTLATGENLFFSTFTSSQSILGFFWVFVTVTKKSPSDPFQGRGNKFIFSFICNACGQNFIAITLLIKPLKKALNSFTLLNDFILNLFDLSFGILKTFTFSEARLTNVKRCASISNPTDEIMKNETMNFCEINRY